MNSRKNHFIITLNTIKLLRKLCKLRRSIQIINIRKNMDFTKRILIKQRANIGRIEYYFRIKNKVKMNIIIMNSKLLDYLKNKFILLIDINIVSPE